MVTAARRWYPFDALMYFIEDLTLTASDIIQEGGVDKILTVGDGRIDGTLVIDVAALDIATGDEDYHFVLQGSNSPTFASLIENLAHVDIGAAAARLAGASVLSLVGRYEVPFSNSMNGVEYKYLRLNMIAVGAVAVSITFSAFISLQSPS